MDERITNGRPSGDSRTGRHMFGHLRRAGVDVLAAGSSDWVVFAAAGGYPEDEAYFLHFIIHTLHQALAGHPALDGRLFEAWITQRHAQIEAGTLVYVAHQLDFVGVKFCGRETGRLTAAVQPEQRHQRQLNRLGDQTRYGVEAGRAVEDEVEDEGHGRVAQQHPAQQRALRRQLRRKVEPHDQHDIPQAIQNKGDAQEVRDKLKAQK
jgi:hypothetical protein